jgi:putative ABC transport system permease protein
MATTLASVKETWNKVFDNSVFHYFFLDDTYAQQYQSDTRFGKVVATFAGLAVLIACLGLFGLSSFTIVQRTREIGIRKVLGASVSQIVRLLSSDFARIVIIASLLAIPVSYYAMDQWLSNYATRIDLSIWIFAIPVAVVILIALLTVSFQTIRTAVANPVDSLKQE